MIHACQPPLDDAPCSTGSGVGHAQEGILVQIDGSQNPWLEDRGPELTLLIAVDDTTGTVAQAAFHTTEDTRRYLMLREGLIRRRGSSSATAPPCLHCRQEVTAKGVVHWRRTSRRPLMLRVT